MEKILEILEEIQPDVNFLTEEHLITGGILDSFDVVTIAAEIDAQLGVRLPAEELLPENFESARALYDLVQRLARA